MPTAAPAMTPDTDSWRDLLCHYGGHVYAWSAAQGAVVCLRCGGVPLAPPRA